MIAADQGHPLFLPTAIESGIDPILHPPTSGDSVTVIIDELETCGVAAEDDPLGYYRVLGLAPNATQAQIQHAYREWAKTYHPDASRTADSRDFHKIKEAYDTLSDEKRRAKYDAPKRERPSGKPPPRPDNSNAQRASQQQNQITPEAIQCSSCGALSAQPRYCTFSRVISVVVWTRVNHLHGIFCPQCAAKKSLRESAISWLCGWWSVIGIFETPVALWKNLCMGEQPRNVNTHVLISQARYFLSVSNEMLARSSLQQAKRFAEGDDVAILLDLEHSLPENDSKRIKDKWSIYRHSELFGHLTPFVLLAVVGKYCVAIPPAKSLIANWGSALVAAHRISGSLPDLVPGPVPPQPKDIRHVASLSSMVWTQNQAGKYINDGSLPQFTTVEVVGPSTDANFVAVLLPNGQSGVLAKADLGAGDGASAKLEYCQTQTQHYPLNGEIFRKLRSGPNRVMVINAGSNEAVVKFRDATGSVVASLFVNGNSRASVDDFPDGSYRLEFATGSIWSRQCGIFVREMNTQRFPTADTFESWKSIETAQGGRMSVTHFQTRTYTITPVPNGNVQAEPMNQDDFVRD